MKTRQEDRRVQRTRALLQDALVAMILEKGYESTTVQDIIDRANVGRATFYAHFADKDTLLLSRIEDLRGLLKKQSAAHRSGTAGRPRELGFSLAMLEHAKGHWRLYQTLVGRKSGTAVLQRITDMLADLVREDLTALGILTDRKTREMIVQYATSAFMGMLVAWLEQGAEMEPSEVDELFRAVLMQGLAPYARRKAR